MKVAMLQQKHENDKNEKKATPGVGEASAERSTTPTHSAKPLKLL
jgi:hypothetical protein